MVAPVRTQMTSKEHRLIDMDTHMLSASQPKFHQTHYEDGFDEGSDSSVKGLNRLKAMDAIEESWEESEYDLCLSDVNLDRYAITLLLRKWEALCLYRQSYGGSIKIIRKVVLRRCKFEDEFTAQMMVLFLNRLGHELKELFVSDSAVVEPQSTKTYPLGSLLIGLQYVFSLESLVLERVKLEGKETGFHLRCLLANNPILEVLQLFRCTIDDDCYDQLMVALKFHHGLRYLDMGLTNLNDHRLDSMVDALVYSTSNKNLQLLDLSGSFFGEYSLKSLTRLLNHCDMVNELILCSCDTLFHTAWSGSPYYRDFLSAMNSHAALQRVYLSLSHRFTPLCQSLESGTKLKIVYDFASLPSLMESTESTTTSSSPSIRTSVCSNYFSLTDCLLGCTFPCSTCSG